MSDIKPVMLALGAGAGIGGNVAKRFATAGYHSVLARRTDQDGLQRLVDQIVDQGGEASGRLVNAVEEGAIEELIDSIERDVGPIKVALFNLGAQIGNRPLSQTPYKAFELGWRLATFALFRLASSLLPKMEARGGGCLLVTSSTAALRGNSGQHSHAAAMGGRRMLCQTLNAEFAPKGIHVVHILVDGPVNSPDTIGRVLWRKDQFQEMLETKGKQDGVIIPERLAETYYHLAHQHRSCWTHEIDLRPFSEKPWWNSVFGRPE